ncbi:hypothetical protein NLJ89_g4058 [Agrocybe chaxingu]|uniref:Uncharacterized protein n=1 Tax=Agrocybe chaxingu TaxID=84603 RepID=A0A9W8K4N7_9AGAR|nr:hypothetical protein NLJ89_g4058 [Agrocybe chaxingu]
MTHSIPGPTVTDLRDIAMTVAFLVAGEVIGEVMVATMVAMAAEVEIPTNRILTRRDPLINLKAQHPTLTVVLTLMADEEGAAKTMLEATQITMVLITDPGVVTTLRRTNTAMARTGIQPVVRDTVRTEDRMEAGTAGMVDTVPVVTTAIRQGVEALLAEGEDEDGDQDASVYPHNLM